MFKRLTRFESRGQPVASQGEFLRRMAVNLGSVGVLIGLSLAIGMAGYMVFEGMGVVDAYLNASMILGGMGPVAAMTTNTGKIFAGSYALYSGLVLIFSTGILLAPVVHRVLHQFHVADDDDENPSAAKKRKSERA